MQCHASKAPETPEMNVIIKTDGNERLLQVKPENSSSVKKLRDKELMMNKTHYSLLHGHIVDPGANQSVAGNNKARWQVTITSDDCALKRLCQGWQICTKAEIDDHKNINEDCTQTIENCCETESLERNATHQITSCDNSSFTDVEEDEEPENGSILLKEYLTLLATGDARVNFITRVLTQAIRNRTTFVICGTFPALRKPLMTRGWLEKKTIRKMVSMATQSNDGALEQIEKLLRNNVAHFIWYTNKHSPSIRADEKTMVNKFSGCYFTSKVDMCNNLENGYWFYESGVSSIQFPRCYNIYQAPQVSDFKDDYRITACSGILKWFLYVAEVSGVQESWSETGQIPVTAILFALERCTEFVSVHAHEDIDREDYREVSSGAWDQFLDWYYTIMHDHGVLRKNSKVKINELLNLAKNILTAVLKCRYQGQLDGMRNIWILKPGDKSLGKGIVLMDRLPDILNKISMTTREGMQYVVQKYIERPLLVYKKKVDVRQWFLITSTHPLVVWLYRDILIRFASRDFTLNNFHESIHLCNTTVQIKYRKNHQQNSEIPRELHWNLYDFKNYLKYGTVRLVTICNITKHDPRCRFHLEISTARILVLRDKAVTAINMIFTYRQMHQETAWDKIILPGIKQNLIGALLASQDNMVNRKNSFQLYGADFVIMDDFSVWLIEINTNPRLHPPSSVVTSKLYPEVIEDIIKVVIDRRKNKRAPLGKFTRIFKQRNPGCGANVLGQGTCLGIRGRSVLQSNKTLGNLQAKTTTCTF